jgi:hypothetical protein
MIALAALLSLVIGGALGLLGGGGSVLMMPMLLWVTGLDERAAISTSLLVVGLTSVAAAVRHAKAGHVSAKTAFVFAPPAMVGAFVGGKLAGFIPASVLVGGFALLMLGSAWAMARGRSREAPPIILRTGPVVALGVVVGLIAGLVGAGGGFLIVPALALAGGVPMRTAVGTSLVVIALQSGAGFLGHLGQAQLPWGPIAVVASMSLVGSWLGAGLAERVQPDKLRKGFAGLVVVVAVLMMARTALKLLGGA